MLTAIVITFLALITVAYAAVPLLARGQVDPLPDERDPVLVDLEEERDSLLRAIRELDGRVDLAIDRRDALRARYEAKAALVLKALEEASATSAEAASARLAATRGAGPAPRTAPGRRLPLGALALLGVAAVTTATLGSFVLPRVGQGLVTTFFADDLRTAEALRDLIRAADRDPSVANLMALGDAYWTLEDAAGAETVYRRLVGRAREDATTISAPALAYKRLALLALQTDLGAALELLREARQVDPGDAEVLFAIAELSFAQGDLDAATEGFEAYLATPDGAGDGDARARLDLVQALGPATAAVAERRDRTNLLTLADVFWASGAQDPAVELYFEILSEHDSLEPTALSRVGQLLFTRGRTDDAIGLLERAAGAAGGLVNLEPLASLFLGNAYAVAGDDEGAVRAWEEHVALVGVEAAGRVTGLIEGARARLDGVASGAAAVAAAPSAAANAGGEPGAATPGAPAPGVAAAGVAAPGVAAPGVAAAGVAAAQGAAGEARPASAEGRAEVAFAALSDPAALLRVGADLYQANCAICHGAAGQGGTGPRLTGNARAANEANLRSLIRFGRGIMPGFGATLAESEVEVLVRWVSQELAAPR